MKIKQDEGETPSLGSSVQEMACKCYFPPLSGVVPSLYQPGCTSYGPIRIWKPYSDFNKFNRTNINNNRELE